MTALFILGIGLCVIGLFAEVDGIRRMNRATVTYCRASETFNRSAENFQRATDAWSRAIAAHRAAGEGGE